MRAGREQQRGLLAAVTAYVAWGLLTLYWRQLQGLDALDLVGWRVATAVVTMLVIVAATGRLGELRSALADRRSLAVVALASTLITVNWSTYVWAVVNGHVIETALGYFLSPLATMGFGAIVLGEPLTPLKRVSIGFAVVAIVVLTASYGRMPWIALLLAASWTTYSVSKRSVVVDAVTGLTAELLVLGVPAGAIVVASFARADGLPHAASATDWPLIAGLGAITAAPLLLFAFAAPRVPFTILGPAGYLIPIINFLLGWLVFDEALPATRVVGFALVWLALMAVTIDTIRIARAAASDSASSLANPPVGMPARR